MTNDLNQVSVAPWPHSCSRTTHVRTVFPTPGPPIQRTSCWCDWPLIQSRSAWLRKNHSPVPGARLAWTSLCFCRLVTEASQSSISVVLLSGKADMHCQCWGTLNLSSRHPIPCSLSSAVRIPCEISRTSVALSWSSGINWRIRSSWMDFFADSSAEVVKPPICNDSSWIFLEVSSISRRPFVASSEFFANRLLISM